MQETEHLPGKHDALSSILSTVKKKKTERYTLFHHHKGLMHPI
jgi:hypothetical protein